MADTASAAVSELVARFRRQRPLRGGSLLVTIFGDAILPRGGAIALSSLIALGEPFGLNERLVRTASARLAKDGWLDSKRIGKLSEYHLSVSGRERFADATKRIYNAGDNNWSGRWTVIVIPAIRAADRKELREELTWRGFGELSSGVFAHPEVDARALRQQLRTSGLLAKAIIFDANLTDPDGAQKLVTLGWDLEELGIGYQRFVKRFERIQQTLARFGAFDPLSSFIVRTLLIHEYRRLHLRDPLLPQRLLRANWPGVQAADVCRDIYSRVFAASEIHLSAVALQLSGPLPPPGASIRERFGGLTLDQVYSAQDSAIAMTRARKELA
jgi:phenylacetic acid degradation operon negative regulatory protein